MGGAGASRGQHGARGWMETAWTRLRAGFSLPSPLLAKPPRNQQTFGFLMMFVLFLICGAAYGSLTSSVAGFRAFQVTAWRLAIWGSITQGTPPASAVLEFWRPAQCLSRRTHAPAQPTEPLPIQYGLILTGIVLHVQLLQPDGPQLHHLAGAAWGIAPLLCHPGTGVVVGSSPVTPLHLWPAPSLGLRPVSPLARPSRTFERETNTNKQRSSGGQSSATCPAPRTAAAIVPKPPQNRLKTATKPPGRGGGVPHRRPRHLPGRQRRVGQGARRGVGLPARCVFWC